MIKTVPATANEKTKAIGNKRHADALRDASDLRNSPLAVTVWSEVWRRYVFAKTAAVINNITIMIRVRKTKDEIHAVYTHIVKEMQQEVVVTMGLNMIEIS